MLERMIPRFIPAWSPISQRLFLKVYLQKIQTYILSTCGDKVCFYPDVGSKAWKWISYPILVFNWCNATCCITFFFSQCETSDWCKKGKNVEGQKDWWKESFVSSCCTNSFIHDLIECDLRMSAIPPLLMRLSYLITTVFWELLSNMVPAWYSI